jgi:hypothetical protein
MFDTDRATIDITAVQSVDSILALFILSKSNETKTTAEREQDSASERRHDIGE